jgi:hypothetical protein
VNEQTRRKVLIGLLVAIVVFAGFKYLPDLLSDEDGGAGAGRLASTAGTGAGPDLVRLDLERLDEVQPGYTPGRNPFSYYVPPPPPRPEPVGPTPEELARMEAERQAQLEEQRRLAEERANQPPPPPKPPDFQLTYLGSFGPESRRIAVFTDGEEIFNALVGDVLAGQFEIAEIGFESVTITYVDFPDAPATQVGLGG